MEEDALSILNNWIERIIPGKNRLLELGCGSGSLVKELGKKYNVYVRGIDPMYYGNNNRCISRGAEEVDKIGEWFDLVYSIHSLHHFSNVKIAMKAMKRVIGWQGEFIFVDWKRGADTGFPERYFSLDEIYTLLRGERYVIREVKEYKDNFLVYGSPSCFSVAVATDDGDTINKGMFGRAEFFDIYEICRGSSVFIERKVNPYKDTFQHLKTLDVYKIVDDCPLIISYSIGPKGQERLHKMGVKMYFKEGKIPEVLESLEAVFFLDS